MVHKLQNLAKLLALQKLSADKVNQLISLAEARYQKQNTLTPYEIQPAFKYIIYLKLMRNLPDRQFHYMKRKYLDTSAEIQREFQKELQELIKQDAKKLGTTMAEVTKEFKHRLANSQALVKSLMTR